MLTGTGAAAAVVIATGYVVESAGSVHVDPEAQAALGAVVAVSAVMLPVVTNVPAFGSVRAPLVKVVAETVTCQPAATPEASLTTYDWCASVGSTNCWSRPVAVVAHPSAVGEVRVSGPAVTPSVPVSVQGVPAAIGGPHATAWAMSTGSRADAPIPAASSPQALNRRASCHFLLHIRRATRHFPPYIRCLIPALSSSEL